VYIDTRFQYGRLDSEANEFAMALLMPRDWIREVESDVPFDVESDPRINEMAKRCRVPLHLMVIRLARLGLLG
jgi:Zn-dependent peptidase ImmA (M78 family)